MQEDRSKNSKVRDGACKHCKHTSWKEAEEPRNTCNPSTARVWESRLVHELGVETGGEWQEYPTEAPSRRAGMDQHRRRPNPLWHGVAKLASRKQRGRGLPAPGLWRRRRQAHGL